MTKLLLYADDSTLIFAYKDPEDISQNLGKELEFCSNWLVDNKPSLYLGKTEYIIFGTKRKLRKVTNFQIQCNDHIIKSQTKLKYLHLDIYQNLPGGITVNSIIKKVNSRLRFMYRKANCLCQLKFPKLVQRLYKSNATLTIPATRGMPQSVPDLNKERP
jgi:hypothetical protein